MTSRKDSIVATLGVIYQELNADMRNEISHTINDLVGKFSENKHHHKAYAEYISVDAKKKLDQDTKGIKISSRADLHDHISKKQNNFRHEHVVPKNAIRLALDYRARNLDTCRVSIREILEAFSGCAIILADKEDPQLHRKTHNDIDKVTGEFCLDRFNKKARYLDTKDGNDIILVEFNAKNYIWP